MWDRWRNRSSADIAVPRSIISTRRPRLTARSASNMPAMPLPRMQRSAVVSLTDEAVAHPDALQLGVVDVGE